MTRGNDEKKDEKILRKVRKEAEEAGMGTSNELTKDLKERISEGKKSKKKKKSNKTVVSSNNS